MDIFCKDFTDGKYRGFYYLVRYLGYVAENDGDLQELERFGINPDWYCGYVEIPKGHPLYKIEYWDLSDVYHSVHGGLTYSGFLLDDDRWFIGFDCNHGDDNSLVQNSSYTVINCVELIDIINYYCGGSCEK